MTENMHYIVDTVTTTINRKYGDTLPTLEQINSEAEIIRNAFSVLYPITDEDFVQVKKTLATNILHTIGVAMTLRGRDSEHQPWYHVQENDGFYWERYKTYLKVVKHWGVDVVNRLNKTSSDVMDDLGNPKDHNRPFQRRGLLLGDVQSGKTATYTAICNKASDAGYRVIIVLAGMMENLRVQTQERLDAEFVGVESKYTLDKKADHEIKNKPVGVGKIPPSNPDKRIACFTSVATDFNKATLRALGLSLRTLNGTALFVVKKNKSVLNNLYKWLMENNADYENVLIDLPLLLIDDEADNASVNTNSEERDPTAINKAIRNILNCFRQASYLGITATPFANIFIDPEAETDEAAKDLFPKDFLTVLPTPELYIGADKIFGNGDADNWEAEDVPTRCEGIYGKAIIPIMNEEQEDYFVFKHKKDLADELYDIPYSTMLYNHIITKTTDVAMERFKALKQGQNFHALSDNLKTNTYTDASRTQNTIYLRLNYDEPSGTVVNVRKSMWIHPTLDRAISVREAARLQTFPDSFIFCGSKDKQYQQVGNAVPPIMAKAIAKKLAKLLGNN